MHIWYTDDGDVMRFELYSYIELFGAYQYRFQTESEALEPLLLKVVTTPLPDGGWIYIDNEGNEDGWCTLGFCEKPTAERCFQRVLCCKLSKALCESGVCEPIWDTDTFENQQTQMVLKAANESKKICAKFLLPTNER